MKSWFVKCLLVISVVACGGGGRAHASPATPRPPTPPAVHQMRPVEWTTRTTSVKLWRKTTQRLQVVVTRTWDPKAYFVWFIENGTTPLHVFRATENELSSVFVDIMRDMTMATVDIPGSYAIVGSQGAVKKPIPDPPPGPIYPEKYVDQVLDLAWQSNISQGPISGAAFPPLEN